MKVKKIEQGFVVVLERGEEIISSISNFFENEKLGFASISGIGATDKVVVGYFDREKREYVEKEFSGINFEIVSLLGNVTWFEGKPKIHLHVCLGNKEYQAVVGHLVSAVTSVTCELTLITSSEKIQRKKDEISGLPLIN